MSSSPPPGFRCSDRTGGRFGAVGGGRGRRCCSPGAGRGCSCWTAGKRSVCGNLTHNLKGKVTFEDLARNKSTAPSQTLLLSRPYRHISAPDGRAPTASPHSGGRRWASGRSTPPGSAVGSSPRWPSPTLLRTRITADLRVFCFVF